MPHDVHMTRLMLHQGMHMHLVQRGSSRAALQRIKELVKEAITDVTSGSRKIQMNITKRLVLDSVVRKQVQEGRSISHMELSELLQQMYPLIQTQRYTFIIQLLSAWW